MELHFYGKNNILYTKYTKTIETPEKKTFVRSKQTC